MARGKLDAPPEPEVRRWFPADLPKLSSEEVARLGDEIFERRVKPLLTPEDDGKFAVIDLATEEYEVDAREWLAVKRLGERRRGSQFWVVRINKEYRMSFRMRYGQ